MIFNLTDRTRRAVAGVVALAFTGAGVAGAIAAATASPSTPAAKVAPRAAGAKASTVPSEVLKLDYLEREIQLRSKAGRKADERAAIRSLGSTWLKVRPWLVQAGGATVATAYDIHVKGLRAGTTPAAVQNAAVTGLDLVNKMEAVFLGK